MSLLGIGLLAGNIGLDIFGTFREQEEIDRRARIQKEQMRLKQEQIRSLAGEEIHELARTGVFAVGTTKSRASKWVKAGTGSAGMQENMIFAQIARRMRLIAKRVGYETYSLERDIKEVGEQVHYAKGANWWDLGAGLLGKGLMFGKEMGWLE